MQKSLLFFSFKSSLIIQIVTGLVTIFGMFLKLKSKDQVLKDILIIENVVQIIEAIFYVYIILAFTNINKSSIVTRRYLDWVITTPIMLLSTVMFMIYKNKEAFEPNKTVTTKNILKENKNTLLKIGLYNFLMLLFGFLGEANQLDKSIATTIGFLFFFLSFYEIWKNYANKLNKNKNLYYFLITIWALYGVASVLPTISKNIMYNYLDIIAKNFYGLYIFYEIYKVSI